MKKFLIIVLAFAMMGSCAALAEGELHVNGTGRVYVEADRVSASLGIDLTGEDLGELQQQANNIMAAVIEALKEAGLDDQNISTNYINISPRYDYSSDFQGKMIGYNINNSLTISTDEIDNIGSYIDAALAAGANNFDSIEFSVKDDSAARKQALELAVEAAKNKAEIIANASGETLGEIKQIAEEGADDFSYYNSTVGGAQYMTADAAADGGVGVTVRAAQILVEADVQLTYALQ